MTSERGRSGQFRVLEVVFSAIIIIGAYSFSTYIMAPANTPVIRGKEELEILGYNLLNRISAGGTLELTAIKGNTGWEENLKIILTRVLPPATYFNMTIYNTTSNPYLLSALNTKPITNVQAAEAIQAFSRAPEVASSTYVYTSDRGWILLIYLRLAHAGEIAQ